MGIIFSLYTPHLPNLQTVLNLFGSTFEIYSYRLVRILCCQVPRSVLCPAKFHCTYCDNWPWKSNSDALARKKHITHFKAEYDFFNGDYQKRLDLSFLVGDDMNGCILVFGSKSSSMPY